MIKKTEYIKMLKFLATFSMITGSLSLYYSFEKNESNDNIYHLGLLILWEITAFLALLWVSVECSLDDDNMINEFDTNYMLIKIYTALPIAVAVANEVDISFLLGLLGGCFVVWLEGAYKRKRKK